MKTVSDLNHKAAQRFFFRAPNYFSLAMPSYFRFEQILEKTQNLLKKCELKQQYCPSCHPRTLRDINYHIIYNKDGEYAWRRYQLIHPFFYVEMVKILTQVENWSFIKQRLREFRNPKVKCASMILAPTTRLNKNEQDIFNWAGNFTNETVRKALEYKYMLTTDMANCYDSLAFYLLPWALHESRSAKQDGEPNIVGYQMFDFLQDMTFGQSCGIPQGSVLMDFLAEIILSFIDRILYERLIGLDEVLILRYRDDYRILANEVTAAQKAMKILVETLAEFNLKINLSKTFATSDVIKHAFKPDRMDWKRLEPLLFGEGKLSTLKSLLLMRDFGRQYPNCGSLKAGLSALYSRDIHDAGCHDDIWQVTSVVVDIMYTNPGIWPHAVAILSKCLEHRQPEMIIKIVEFIRKKFAEMPNTEYLEIWLQRLSIKANPYYQYEKGVCDFMFDRERRIWNSDWLGMYTGMCDTDTICYDEILQMPTAIPVEEVALFITNHGSGG